MVKQVIACVRESRGQGAGGRGQGAGGRGQGAGGSGMLLNVVGSGDVGLGLIGEKKNSERSCIYVYLYIDYICIHTE
jgi:hypothetical protein